MCYVLANEHILSNSVYEPIIIRLDFNSKRYPEPRNFPVYTCRQRSWEIFIAKIKMNTVYCFCKQKFNTDFAGTQFNRDPAPVTIVISPLYPWEIILLT